MYIKDVQELWEEATDHKTSDKGPTILKVITKFTPC